MPSFACEGGYAPSLVSLHPVGTISTEASAGDVCWSLTAVITSAVHVVVRALAGGGQVEVRRPGEQ